MGFMGCAGPGSVPMPQCPWWLMWSQGQQRMAGVSVTWSRAAPPWSSLQRHLIPTQQPPQSCILSGQDQHLLWSVTWGKCRVHHMVQVHGLQLAAFHPTKTALVAAGATSGTSPRCCCSLIAPGVSKNASVVVHGCSLKDSY